VIDPSNVQTVYAGTGEENFSGDSLLVASDFGVLSLDQRRRGLHAGLGRPCDRRGVSSSQTLYFGTTKV
jgi:hypothetical protein